MPTQHYSKQDRTPHVRFLVSRPDGVTWEDLSDYLSYAEVELGQVKRFGATAGVDQVVRQATFTLSHTRQMMPVWNRSLSAPPERVVGQSDEVIGTSSTSGVALINRLFGVEHRWAGEGSFHPLDRRSPWNYWNDQYNPLLFSRRECILEVAFTPPGELPESSDWVRIFEGIIGDSIRNKGAGAVEFTCRDQAKLLMDTYIDQRRTYGSDVGEPAEDIIGAILTDNEWSSIASDLWVPSSPGFMIHPYEVDFQSVWDAIQQIPSPIGWFLGFRFRPDEGRCVLAFMEPPRTKGAGNADFTLSARDEIIVQTLDISDLDIRNIVEVHYRDAATGSLDKVIVQDEPSIAVYGKRRMVIGEKDTPFIRTQADATTFALRVLSDLSGLRGTTRIESRMLPSLDIFSGVLIDDERLSSTLDFYGVESVRHVLDMTGDEHKYRTEFVASSKVIGGHAKWLQMDARRGASMPLAPEEMVGGSRIMQKPTGVSARGIIRGVAIDVPVPPVNLTRWAETEIHLSTTEEFEPSPATRVDGGKKTHFEITDAGGAALVSGTKYYMRARYIDMAGNPGPYSDEVSATADYLTSDEIDPTPPDDVTGLVVDFTGPDAIATWAPAARATRYRVRVIDPDTDTPVRTVEISGTSFRYSYADNVQDFGGNGSPSIKISVEGKNEAGFYSATPTVEPATCPAPEKPTVVATSDRAEIRWTITSEISLTWKSTTTAVGSFEQTAPVLNGVIDAEGAGLADGQLVTLSVTINDVFGRSSEAGEKSVTVKYIDKLAFVQSLKPVELVSALPELPNPDYPQGSVVFLTTDDKLYRSTGDEWTAEVPTTDLSGTITETQIANDAITTPKLKAGAVVTEKLAAGAVTADQLAANAVTSGKIAAGAVTADAIAADQIGAEHIRVGDPVDRAVKNVNVSNLPNALPQGGQLFHFDQSLLSTQGVRPESGSVATLRPSEGRFGGAVAVEAATENLANNPTFDGTVDTSPDGWHADVTIKVDTLNGQSVNVAELLCEAGNEFEDFGTGISYDLQHDTTYTISYWARGTMSITADLSSVRGIASFDWIENPAMSLEWQKYVLQIHTEESGSIYPFWWFLSNQGDANVGKWVRIAFVQLEELPYATSFVDGTRAVGKLQYPQLLNPARGTLSVWINPHYLTNWNHFFQMSISTGRFLLFFNNSGLAVWDFGTINSGPSKAGAVAAGRWDMHTLTWDADEEVYAYYLNGELVGEETYVAPDSFPATLPTVANHNALIDELVVLPTAAPAEQIRAWYELQAPFYDASQVAVGGRGSVVIDHTGAWGYDAAGNKRAGFGTDGKWIAGGGAIEADEQGLRVMKDGNPTFDVNVEGDAWFGGDVRANSLILPIRSV